MPTSTCTLLPSTTCFRSQHHRGQATARPGAMSRDDAERLHTAVLVAPASEKRRIRKQRRQAAAKLQAHQQRAEQQASRAKYAADLAERRATTYISPAAEHGTMQMRSTGRLRLPPPPEPSATPK